MPHINGFELCEKILAIDINVKVCFMSCAAEINLEALREIYPKKWLTMKSSTYSTDLYTNIMMDQIKKFHSDGKPLFMYLSYQADHSPFQAPQAYIKKYEGVYNVGYDKIREQRFEKQKELGIWPSNMTATGCTIMGWPRS